MKIISKAIVAIIVLFFSMQSFGQRIGVKGGLNLSNMLEKNDFETVNNLVKPGFHLGAIINLPLFDMISLEPGIQLTVKGDRSESGSVKHRTNLTYIEFPVLAKFSYKVSDISVIGIAGPTVGIGLSGRFVTKDDNNKDITKVDWGNDKNQDDYKRPDLGILIGAGIEMKSFQFTISYNIGLINIDSNTDLGNKVKNRVVCISAAYFFAEL